MYERLEKALLGDALSAMRTCFLGDESFQQARRILILGEGDGRFLEAALVANELARFHVIDGSPAMLEKAAARLSAKQRSRVKFKCGNAAQIDLGEKVYDGLVMHCFLDCFTEDQLRGYLLRWVASVSRSGWIWIGDFVEPSRLGWAWLRLRALFWFFRAVTGIDSRHVCDPNALMEASGWKCRHAESFARGGLASKLYEHCSQD